MLRKSVHTPEQKVLQQLLKSIRYDAGLNQRQLAERLGVPQSRVSDYERGESLPDILVLRQYLKMQGVTLSAFVEMLEGALTGSDLPV